MAETVRAAHCDVHLGLEEDICLSLMLPDLQLLGHLLVLRSSGEAQQFQPV